MVGVVALGLVALWLPELVPSVPEPASLPAMATLVLGLAFYGLLALRALRTVMLTRRRADLGVFLGLVWLAGALVPALMAELPRSGLVARARARRRALLAARLPGRLGARACDRAAAGRGGREVRPQCVEALGRVLDRRSAQSLIAV